MSHIIKLNTAMVLSMVSRKPNDPGRMLLKRILVDEYTDNGLRKKVKRLAVKGWIDTMRLDQYGNAYEIDLLELSMISRDGKRKLNEWEVANAIIRRGIRL